MNQLLVGALSTLVTLGGIGILAQPKQPPAKPAPVVPAMTPDQVAALRQAFDLPPGSEVEVEITSKDGGSVRTREEGHGKGAGAVAEGDKLDQQFNGSPPKVGRGADGSQSAEGGGSDADQKGSALKLPAVPWKNPLFWIGLAAIGVCAFSVYSHLRRLALISGVSGVALLAAAFYPIILLFAVAAVVLVIFGPYIYTEFKKKKAEQETKVKSAESDANYEALRAVVAGVEHKDIPADIRGKVKAAIAKEADVRDKQIIDLLKQKDGIGKYAE